MTETEATINSIAPLANVSLCSRALERAVNRPAHLPGMVTFYGPSGWGKSFSAAYTANRFRAYYVECKSSWTRKALLVSILKSMGIMPAPTIYEMTEQISEQLALSGRPLIVDEMDHIVKKQAVEILRDIYEGSNAAILMIGEEHLPSKLKAWERFHNRMLEWVPAQPADLEDTGLLARLYSPDVRIEEDLLELIQRTVRGCVRRICVNLELIRTTALEAGLDEIDIQTWNRSKRKLYTGEPPKRGV